jgi:hypothetical protein
MWITHGLPPLVEFANRVMALLRRLNGRLHLTVNETKSAVASVFGRKFLGYGFWVGPEAWSNDELPTRRLRHSRTVFAT